MRESDPRPAYRQAHSRLTLFDLLTGNVDGHGKNHALLHVGHSVRVAPRYDLLPPRLDPNLTDQLAFNIGNATTLASITNADFFAFLGSLGVRNPTGQRRVTKTHTQNMAQCLIAAFDDLGRLGMKPYADLIAANIRQLLPVLGLDVPDAAGQRDAFVQRGGGWSQG